MVLPTGKSAAQNIIAITAALYATRTEVALAQVDQALAKRQALLAARDGGNTVDPKQVRLQQQQISLLAKKDAFADTASLLSTTASAIDTINVKIISLKASLQSLNAGSTAQERADVAAIFKAGLAAINTAVDGAEENGINLIGDASATDFSTDDVATNYGLEGAYLSVAGTYLGSETRLTDAGGNTYVVNQGDQTLVQYAPYPDTPTGTVYSLDDLAASLSSFDSGTGQVTFAGAVNLTATVERHGLGILDSYLYGDFQNDADVARAIADLDAAAATLEQVAPDFGVPDALLNNAVNLIDTQLQDLDRKLLSRIQSNLSEKAAVEDARALADNALTYRLALAAQSQAAVVDLLQVYQVDRTSLGVVGYLRRR